VPIIIGGGAIGCQTLLKLANRDHGRWQSFYAFVPGLLLLSIGRALDLKLQSNEFCHLPMVAWGGISLMFGAVILYTG